MTSAVALASRLSAWRPPLDSVGIVALGQAGFALVSRTDLVLIDPFLSPRPNRLADAVVDPRGLLGVTAVLATHEHGDHLDLPTWVLIAGASPNARFVVPARHAVAMEDGYSLGDQEHRAPRFVGYVVELDGVRLYHAGDTLTDEVLIAAVAGLRPDIALLPINGRDPDRERRGIVGNMSPDEAARMARDLSVALAIPMHFDMIRGNLGRPDAFVRAMRRRHPTASVWVPGSGAAFVWPSRGGSWQAATS